MTPWNEGYIVEAARSRETCASTTIALTPFDQKPYRALIQARGETIRRVISELKPVLWLATALDVGCGIGFFSEILRQCGLSVGAFDGREENVMEARRRFPGIPFERGDIEDAAITRMGKFDLVLCFGLLYHLENPMLALRHLRALTGKGLLLESMCVPGKHPALILREEPRAADQSLTDVALYPTEDCLVKMLYRSGFQGVYRVTSLPDHEDFHETAEHVRRRTLLFASVAPFRLRGFEAAAEPQETGDPWAKNGRDASPFSLWKRLRRFADRPLREKYVTVARRARRWLPALPIPLRLPFGAWWLAQNSELDVRLMGKGDSFEGGERKFVACFLRPGMTVLDVGAHHGLYSLLASRHVGQTGKVVAFEPSPRERRRLMRHLHLNACRNVTVQPYALAAESGVADFFVVEGSQDWCNSLRPPAVEQRTSKIHVEVRRADDVIEDLEVQRVDFIKLDVEGAELHFLRGAVRVLWDMRPAILAEVQDCRTQAWGYAAREIIEFLQRLRYRCFDVTVEGQLEPFAPGDGWHDANLVALPEERVDEIRRRLVDERRVRLG